MKAPDSPASFLDELAQYLRPPGQGIFAVSTGKAELERFTESYLGAPAVDWRGHLDGLLDIPGPHPVALLAIPSDCGAGIVRGAAWGPQALRQAFGQAPVFDLGDVISVPHFIDDDMLSRPQLERSRRALYPERPDRDRMPVAPVSIGRRVMRLLRWLRPDLRVLLLGGDHTVTGGVLPELLGPLPEDNQDAAIVHFDAHTDLLPERLGVLHCFATWAFHANERLGGGRRLLQLGIRASEHDKRHWEEHCGVAQMWAKELQSVAPEDVADRVQSHLQQLGARRIYISNDLDGTDQAYAAACGTPEPNGLHPDQVLAVVDRLTQLASRGTFQVVGADVVELAPGLSLDRDASKRSIQTAKRYAERQLKALAAG